MDSTEFRKHGKEMIDFVAKYWETLPDRQALSNCKPGFIWDLVPKEPPKSPETWDKIFADIEKVVFANNTNWHHPHFFAYFPTACSYPSIIGDILSGGIASIGFSWKSSPSMTELEMACVDWVAQSISLPNLFLNASEGPGGGMIQSTASDATNVAILSARARAIANYKRNNINEELCSTISKTLAEFRFKNAHKTESTVNFIDEEDPIITFENHDASVITKLVAYCSDQAHSSVDKGIMLAGVKMRKLKSVVGGLLNNYFVEPARLEAAIKKDRSHGFIPFIYVATVGTTNTCGVEMLRQIGEICNRENIWLHVDAAYAGSFAVCPEFRYLIDGVELADSFNFNPHKAMQINFDCSVMWFKDVKEATSYFNVDAEYLKHEHQAIAADYRHLQIALGRRFRSFKIWFVFRALGIEYIQKTLKERVNLANEFAKLIEKDDDFELFVPPHIGLVCFRYKSDNETNDKLVAVINNDHRIHIVPGKVHGTLFLRLAICSALTTSKDIHYAYMVTKDCLSKVLQAKNNMV